MTIIYLLLIGLVVLNLYIFYELKQEKKRTRILGAFISGIIVHLKKEKPYPDLLEDIANEFGEDFWIEPFKKWQKKDRLLFYNSRMGNGGFNMKYWDLHDKLFSEEEKN
ncbi:MAG: hypothetical protein PHU04_01265 [Candidatus Peribacteraceae bacterium]|nr:hypothetical protein [Candidatus Peribacteraceae bacterium]